MRLAIIAMIMLGCGRRTPAPAPIANQANAPAPPPERVTISGRVSDASTGEALVGVTVIVTDPAGAAEAPFAEGLSDEAGRYELASLPPRRYVVTMYYVDIAVRRDVDAERGDVVVDQQLDGRWMSSGIHWQCTASTTSSCKPIR